MLLLVKSARVVFIVVAVDAARRRAAEKNIQPPPSEEDCSLLALAVLILARVWRSQRVVEGDVNTRYSRCEIHMSESVDLAYEKGAAAEMQRLPRSFL